MRRGRPPHPDVLTPREWEVLALLRDGLSNRQIGDRLGISERGVKYHVSEILSKLGMTGRNEAVSWKGQPVWRAGVPVGIMTRLSGTLPRLALGLLATAVLALFALALGVLVMERRGGSPETPPAQQWTIEQMRFEMIQLAEEATASARAVTPDSFLYFFAYAAGSGLYTFGFLEPVAARNIAVIGPNNEPGIPRWEVSTYDLPNPITPLPLDVQSLQKTPTAILQQAGALRPGASSGSTVASVGADPSTGELVWGTSAAGPGGQISTTWPPRPLVIRCEVKDAAPVSTMTCEDSKPPAGPE